MRIDYICRHIVKSVHTSVRCYEKDVKVKEFGEIQGQEDVFVCDPEFEKKLLSEGKISCPYMHFEENAVVYAVVAAKYDVKYVIGPICVDRLMKDALETLKRKHGIKGEYRIARGRLDAFSEEVLLLHNLLNDDEMTYQHMIEENLMNEFVLHSVQKQMADVSFVYHENEKLHNPYEKELRETECIRQGDVEGLRRNIDELFQGEFGTLSRNSLQAAKNLAICGIIIASRAAISGGLLPETVFTLCDSYILKIDEATSIGQPDALTSQAAFHFAELVAQQKEKQHSNVLIEECKNIIFRNIHSKILIKDIAEELFVNPNYLSNLFQQIEKISIHDFIEQEKIRLAENMLIYSEYTIKEIGYYLGFCSQSHFGRVFKKWKRMTPVRFRNSYGVRV